nr:zinc finger protein 594-like [Onthophagus taurus]
MQTCRLCLKSPEEPPNIQLESLSTKCYNYIELILPEIDLSLTEAPRICYLCLNSLENAYTFKIRCLESEKHLQSIKNDHDEADYEILVFENEFEEIENEITFDGNTAFNELENNNVNDEIIKNEIEISKYEIVPYENTISNIDYESKDRKGMKSLESIQSKRKKKIDYDFGKCYKCKQCGKKYSVECLLRRHKFNVNLETICVCEICDKEFQYERDLMAHMEVHGIVDSVKKKRLKC